MKKFLILLISLLLLFVPLVFAEDENLNKTANCTYELDLCVKEYNGLLMDFRNGTNCGTGFQLVVDLNNQLKENLKNVTSQKDELESDLKEFKSYKVLFWIMIVLVFIDTIIIFSKNKSKQLVK